MLFTPYLSCPFCTFPPSIFIFIAVFFNFLYTYTKTKAYTVCGRAQASILLSFWRRLNDDMGEKVVRRKHLKTANQGVDGRFSRSFLLLLLLFFFHKPSQPCEKCYRKSNKKSKFREKRYACLSGLWPTISQQRGQSLDGREKKNDARLRHGVRRPCKLIEKVDRPATSRDASPIATIWSIWRDNILQRSIP